jgi:DNA-binding response OmpR family regulator/predicted  nucleic acid-binding Zn-ribbon protein
MSKTVLIIEKDQGLSRSIREALEGRGFGVEESSDGKGAPELIRRSRPDCVVLAVDLDAGQNGYIICKKLKSDDDLKGVPVVIIGDPKGFGQHQKLKTRAEEYVGKPLEAPDLAERIGGLIGFPEPADAPAAASEGDFDPGSLLEEEGTTTSADEIALESSTSEETVGSVDPDFEMVDSMFEDKAPPPVEEIKVSDSGLHVEEEVSLSSTGDEEAYPAEKTVVGFMPPAPPPPRRDPPPFTSSTSTVGHDADSRDLRAKVTELTGSLDEARERSTELEARVRELETELETKGTELEAARASGPKSDNKEVFTLKDSINKKDKEILRLKNELNTREQELVELRDKENALEQQASESSGELARKDAQVKTLQAKADQVAAERKKVDQQLLQAKEEARSASAKLSTLQSDYDTMQARLSEVEAELEPLRTAQGELENAKAQADNDLSEARGEIDALKSQLDERAREADEVRGQLEQAQIDLDSARNQLTTQATTFADEISGLRQKLADVEAETARHEERAARHQSRVKAQQEQLERLRETLQQALGSIETPSDSEDLDIDELAEA